MAAFQHENGRCAERFVIPDDLARAAAGEGRRDDAGTDFALKVGWPHPEAEREADGLRTWDGAGAVRLCQVRELAEATMLLLERCRPGTQLRASPPEEHDLVIAGLLRRLWIKPPPGHRFRPLSDMCDYWANRYEERSPSERSCLKAPLAKEGTRLLDLDLNRILLWLFARAVEASPYWGGMPDLAQTLYPLLT